MKDYARNFSDSIFGVPMFLYAVKYGIKQFKLQVDIIIQQTVNVKIYGQENIHNLMLKIFA